MSSAIVFLLSALLFVPWLGAYGAALSVITGFLVGTAAMAYFSQRGPSPLLIEWGRARVGIGPGGRLHRRGSRARAAGRGMAARVELVAWRSTRSRC